ncbi:guanine nucleotide-binding protein G(i) subunit alpha-3-like [Discoglossus pictus]
MGCILTAEEKAAAARSKQIDQYLLEDRGKVRNELNVLVLSSGESGKSSFMKQMKILHEGGFSEEERKLYKEFVYRDIMRSITSITSDMARLGIDFGDKARADDARQLLALEEEVISEELVGVMRRLLDDVGVQACINCSCIANTTKYYLNNLDRISQADYILTQQDMLHVRVQPTTINYISVKFKSHYFRIFARFDRILIGKIGLSYHAIIFCGDLSNYDKFFCEENSMHCNIQLFKSICNNRWFRNTPIILFLTKKDLFEEKISTIPLTICFPSYSGSNTYEEATAYIQEQFEAVYRERDSKYNKKLSTHFTCVTDTESVQRAFDAAADFIIHNKHGQQVQC